MYRVVLIINFKYILSLLFNIFNASRLLYVSENGLSFRLEMYYTLAASAYRHCESSKIQVFSNLKEAQRACFEDKFCVGVWNPECNDSRMFYTCNEKKDWDEIEQTNVSNPSCLYRKHT